MRTLLLIIAAATVFSGAWAEPKAEALPEGNPPHPLLAEGFGIDHVILAVRDLEAARSFLRDRLGFKLPPAGVVGKHASGTMNASAYFANQSYLEVLAVADRDLVRHRNATVLDFLDQGEGLLGFALSTSSARQSAARLEQLGIPHTEPKPGSISWPGSPGTAAPKWLTVEFLPASRLPFFLIQYLDLDYADIFRNWTAGFAEASASPYFQQPNTAIGVSAIWVVVPKVDGVLGTYRHLLGSEGAKVGMPDLAAEGYAFDIVRQRLYLLQPSMPSGPAATYVAARGSGVMGVSIEVKDLDAVRSLLRRTDVGAKDALQGPSGRRSLLVPPAEALGAWIEFHAGDR